MLRERVEARNDIGRIPNRCFLRDLKIIDPGLYVVYDGELDFFEIYKSVEKQMGRIRWVETRIIDKFRYLNDSAITQLRYRKYLGRKYETSKSPNKYIDDMDNREKAKKAKVHEEVIDEMSANLETVHSAHTKKHFHT